MKKIEAIVPEDTFSAVFNGLIELGVGGFTYFTVKGRGKRPRSMVASGRARFESQYNLNVDIFVVINDSMVDKVVNSITSNASTGLAGEGKIFVYDVADSVDIGTKKHGEVSL